MQGTKIFTCPYAKIENNNMVLNVSDFTTGYYVVSLEAPDVIYTQKFLKK